MSTKTTMLHELLPIRDGLKGERKLVITEAVETFTKRTEHFRGHSKVYEPFNDESKSEAGVVDQKAMDTTVSDKLSYVFDVLVRKWNVDGAIDATNQLARADVIVNGKTILSNVPATFLLSMENELAELRNMLGVIPTLPPGRRYERDTNIGPNVWRQSDADTSFREVKTVIPKVMYEATKEHPAQVEKLQEVVRIGRYVQNQWFGMLSVAEKSRLLGRLDEFSRAVKAARQRANAAPVVDATYGEAIRAFLLTDDDAKA